MWDLNRYECEYLMSREKFGRCPRCFEKLLLCDMDLGWTNCIGCGLTYGGEQHGERDLVRRTETRQWIKMIFEKWRKGPWLRLKIFMMPTRAGKAHERIDF